MVREVLVVIGAGGMGSAIARRLGPGRHLLLADRDAATLHALADPLRDEGYVVATRELDVTARASVAGLAELAAQAGPVTGVVHTAGVSPTQASVTDIFNVDLLGTALVVEEFGRVVAPNGAGVVIASMAGTILGDGLGADTATELTHRAPEELLDIAAVADLLNADTFEPANRSLAYAIAKRGNQLRVRGAASHWGQRGARINSISPGVISTAMGRAEIADPGTGEIVAAMIAGSPAQRVGTSVDVAAVTDFLLGHGASYITGTDVLIDGGVVAAMTAAPCFRRGRRLTRGPRRAGVLSVAHTAPRPKERFTR